MQRNSVQVEPGQKSEPHHRGWRKRLAAFAFASVMCLYPQAQAQNTISSLEDATNLQQDAFYRGSDQHVYLRYYTPGAQWQIKDVTTLSGAPRTAPGTQITSFKDAQKNQQHVVFQAANGHIYQIYSNSNINVWILQDITVLTGTASAALGTPLVSFVNNSLDIQYFFYVGTNAHLNVFYWFDGWAAADLTSATGLPSAVSSTQLVGFLETNSNIAHVIYQGADQHLREFHAGLDPSQIGSTDLTASSGGTLPALGSNLTGFFDAGKSQNNIFYVGSDAHIHHLSTPSSSSVWSWEDLTAKSGGAAARSGTAVASYVDLSANKSHMFYIGSDLSLRHIYGDSTWSSETVSGIGAAPAPALGTPISGFKDDPDNQLHLFYVGLDGSFYHLYSNGGWRSENLTLGAVLPVVGSQL